MKKTLTALLTAAILFAAIPASAGDLYSTCEREPGFQEPELALSEAQEKELDAIDFETARKEIRITAELDIEVLELLYLMQKQDTPEKTLRAKVKKVLAVEQELRMLEVEYTLAVRELLTPKQWKIWVQWMEEEDYPMDGLSVTAMARP